MKIRNLLNSSGNTTGGTVGCDVRRWKTARCILTIESAGTLVVQGSIDGITFAPLHDSVTASQALSVDTFPYMRGVSSGVSGGDVSIDVMFVEG